MAVALGYDSTADRIARLENEVDRLCGHPPRNRYTCTVCWGNRTVDESFHGSPDYQPCPYCKGGRLIDEANATLLSPPAAGVPQP